MRPQHAQNTQKLHKVLAQAGLGSRREMESLIESGQVTVNGKKAIVGARVSAKDLVKVRDRIVEVGNEGSTRVLLYHKPEGEIVSRDDPEHRPSVFTNLPFIRGAKWISVGRLDYNTSGLLVFTNSGELANRLSHPRFKFEREYQVRVLGELNDEQIRRLTTGICLSDGEVRLDSIITGGGKGVNHWYKVALHEGKNRIVRRIFEELGLTVSRLMRTRFGPLSLPENLKKGQWRELDLNELAQLFRLCGMLKPNSTTKKIPLPEGPRLRAIADRKFVKKNVRIRSGVQSDERKPRTRKFPVKLAKST